MSGQAYEEEDCTRQPFETTPVERFSGGLIPSQPGLAYTVRSRQQKSRHMRLDGNASTAFASGRSSETKYAHLAGVRIINMQSPQMPGLWLVVLGYSMIFSSLTTTGTVGIAGARLWRCQGQRVEKSGLGENNGSAMSGTSGDASRPVQWPLRKHAQFHFTRAANARQDIRVRRVSPGREGVENVWRAVPRMRCRDRFECLSNKVN